jgi:hypothetical protein
METLEANALDDYTGLWIGASDAAVDGTWTWVNGEAFSFHQWAATRPSTAAGNTLDFAEVSGGAGAEIRSALSWARVELEGVGKRRGHRASTASFGDQTPGSSA